MVALGHLPAIQLDAPNVDVAARLAVSHHIDSPPAKPSAGASFGLVVITPPPYDPKVPHHHLDDEMRHVNDVPPQHRVLAHRNRRALTVRADGASTRGPARPRGRAALFAHPPTPLDDTARRSLGQLPVVRQQLKVLGRLHASDGTKNQ